MTIIHAPYSINRKLKLVNFFVLISIVVFALPFNCSLAGGGGDGGGGDDTTSPSIVITSDKLTFTATPFTEEVTGFALEDITVVNGTAGTFQTANNIIFTAVITPAAAGPVTIDVAAGAATDAALNPNTAAVQYSITCNPNAPGVTVSTSSQYTKTSPIPVTITFTEAVTGFDDMADINITNWTGSNLFTGDNITFTLDITPSDNTITIQVPEDVCNALDDSAINCSSNMLTIHYDITDPTVVISSAANKPTNVSPVPITITFSEEVTGFEFGDITIGNGSTSALDTTDNIVFTMNITPTNEGTVTVDIPGSVCTDLAGNDNSSATQLSIVFYTVKISFTNKQNASVVFGQPNLTSNTAGTSSTVIHGPESVSTNGTKLMIVDYNNNRVLIYNTIPTSSGAAADVVVGQTDFTSSSAGLSATKLNGMESAFITTDKLLIADSLNNRVLIFNSIPTSNGVSADIVLGQTDFTSNGAGTSATTLNNPTDVWSDGTRVIVSDAGNNRILIWNTFPTGNGQAADVVVGQSDFTSNGNGTAAHKFRRQWNFTASSVSNQLFVTDLDNHRVLIFNTIPTANGASADAVLGQATFTTNATGCTQSAINRPCGVCVIDETRIIMIDANNSRALIFEGL